MHKIEYETEELTPLERAEIHTDKVIDYQKKYNVSQKKIAYIIGKNLLLYVCMLIPLLLISFIWAEVKFVAYNNKLIAEGILTVLLFIFGEDAMVRLGTEGGQLDQEFINAKREFDVAIKKANEVGTMLLGVFCDWQIDVELAQAISYRLKMLRLTPKMWEEIKKLSPEEMEARFGKSKAKKMREIINLKPIELNETILLYNGEYTARGGVPESGHASLHKKRRNISRVIYSVFTVLLTIAIFPVLTSEASVARIIYTVIKLIVLLVHMGCGYDRGARAFNTTEVNHLKAKTNYLIQYIKFIEDKIYLKLGDKYGDISQFVGWENLNENVQENMTFEAA